MMFQKGRVKRQELMTERLRWATVPADQGMNAWIGVVVAVRVIHERGKERGVLPLNFIQRCILPLGIERHEGGIGRVMRACECDLHETIEKEPPQGERH